MEIVFGSQAEGYGHIVDKPAVRFLQVATLVVFELSVMIVLRSLLCLIFTSFNH